MDPVIATYFGFLIAGVSFAFGVGVGIFFSRNRDQSQGH